MTNAVGGFKTAVDASYRSGGTIDSSERAMLVDGFRRLTTTDKGEALEYLLARNFDHTYSATAQFAGDACVSLDGFKTGVDAAYRSGGTIDSSERSSLVDAFKRLSTTDKGLALEYLQERNFDTTYAAVAQFAGEAAITYDAFRTGVGAAYRSGGEIDSGERAMLVDGFRRLTQRDMTRSLEHLLERNFPNTYTAVSQFAGDAPLSFDGFERGFNAALRSEGEIGSLECSTLVEAFRRMSTGDKSRALELVLERNEPSTYTAIAQYAGDACVSLDSFKAGMKAAVRSSGDVTSSERSNLVDAFRRMSTGDRQQALQFLSAHDYSHTYQACAQYV